MADSSEVDAALAAKLEADAALGVLVPSLVATDGGVAFDVTNPNATRAIVVSMLAHEDTPGLNEQTLFERFLYLVKVVDRSTSGTTAKQAAARIHELLQNGTLTITGYTLMTMKRVERIRDTEIDTDTDVRWQHRGGHYELYVSPT